MPNYYVNVARAKGEQGQDYGPFPDNLSARQFGKPFAERGMFVSVNLREEEMLCDFCAKPGAIIEWSYPAKDFQIEDADWGSHENWAACSHCHDLIEAEDYGGLARRSVKIFFEKHPQVPNTPRSRMMISRQVAEVQDGFRKARLGPPISTHPFQGSDEGAYGIGDPTKPEKRG